MTGTTQGGQTQTSSQSVNRRLKNEISSQRQQQVTDQLTQLTSQCQSRDDKNTGTLDKTLVRYVTLRRQSTDIC